MTRKPLTFVHVEHEGRHYVRLKSRSAAWILLGAGDVWELLRRLVFVIEGRSRRLSILPGEIEALHGERIYLPDDLVRSNRPFMRWLDQQAKAEACT